jgi:phosphopantothenoylcysteine decarboxylase/phosphopantothenate--cysteine ligase
MYARPETVANLERLRAAGVAQVGPEAGPLAEGPSERPGRMSEPETILAHAARLLRRGGPLEGRRVVVTAGPTREPLDPVRVITNRSSGRMGFELAAAAWERGGDVVLISGPTALVPPGGPTLRRVETTAEMEAAVRDELPSADLLIMAAAPADYRSVEVADRKRARGEGGLSLTLGPTADILVATRGLRKPGALVVGFALETGDAVARGRGKLERKGLDVIVVNDATEPGAGFEVPTNRVTILDRDGAEDMLPLMDKRAVAEAILDRVAARCV